MGPISNPIIRQVVWGGRIKEYETYPLSGSWIAGRADAGTAARPSPTSMARSPEQSDPGGTEMDARHALHVWSGRREV